MPEMICRSWPLYWNIVDVHGEYVATVPGRTKAEACEIAMQVGAPIPFGLRGENTFPSHCGWAPPLSQN